MSLLLLLKPSSKITIHRYIYYKINYCNLHNRMFQKYIKLNYLLLQFIIIVVALDDINNGRASFGIGGVVGINGKQIG